MTDAELVKSKLNIVDIIGERVTVKKTGRNFKALCPFHTEKTPSFIISPDRQVYHCFGCGKGGSAIDFVMEYEHVDFLEALETLADRAGVTLTKRTSDSPEYAVKQKLFDLNRLVSEYYHYILTKHDLGQRALSYLKNRGISTKSITTFVLGYSPNNWEALLRFLRKKKYDEGLIEQSGLAVRGSRGLYDRFRGRIMFTLKDHRGNVVGFAGRVLDPAVKDAKYINTPETAVYNKSTILYGLDVTKDAITKANEAIVMEGEIDVISSFQAGISNVVAIKGSALTDGHVSLLKRFTERLIFALDSDVAGDAAARRGIDIAEHAGLDMKVADMPVGKDPDEAVRENPAGLKKACKQAVPVYDYFIASAVKRFDAASSFGKRKISDEILPILSRIENSIVQGHYIKKLSKALDVTEETVVEGIRSVKSPLVGTLSRKEKEEGKAQERTSHEQLEVYILGLVLQGKTKDLMKEFFEYVPLADLRHTSVRRIFEYLSSYCEGHPAFDIQQFAHEAPKELHPTLDEAYLWDISALLADEEKFTREWIKIFKELRKGILRNKIRVITDKIRALGTEWEKKDARANKEEGNLQKQLVELTKDLKVLEKSD